MNPRHRLWAGFFSLLVILSVVLGLMAFTALPAAAPQACLPLEWFFLNLAFNPLLVN
jgi:hypothetical protein